MFRGRRRPACAVFRCTHGESSDRSGQDARLRIDRKARQPFASLRISRASQIGHAGAGPRQNVSPALDVFAGLVGLVTCTTVASARATESRCIVVFACGDGIDEALFLGAGQPPAEER